MRLTVRLSTSPARVFSQVGRRVGCGQQYLMATGGQFHGNGHCDRGLAHAALTHGHHQALTVGLNVVNQAGQWWQIVQSTPGCFGAHGFNRLIHPPQGIQPHQIFRAQVEVALR